MQSKSRYLLQGSGGIRKLRWSSKGKIGGARVIYLFYNETIPLFLLTIFGKNEKANLNRTERNELAKLVKELIDNYKSKDMSEAYKSISKGLNEAIHYSKGNKEEAGEFRPVHIDVKRLRERIGMSQPRFAASFGTSLGTLRQWERGDRNPQGPALVLLNLLSKDPNTVLEVLNK